MYTIGCNTSVQFGVDYASFVAQTVFQTVLWENQRSRLLSKIVEAPAQSNAGASTLKQAALTGKPRKVPGKRLTYRAKTNNLCGNITSHTASQLAQQFKGLLFVFLCHFHIPNILVLF